MLGFRPPRPPASPHVGGYGLRTLGMAARLMQLSMDRPRRRFEDASAGDAVASAVRGPQSPGRLALATTWLMLGPDKQVEVYRRPSGEAYAEKSVHGPTGSVTSTTVPGLTVELGKLFRDR